MGIAGVGTASVCFCDTPLLNGCDSNITCLDVVYPAMGAPGTALHGGECGRADGRGGLPGPFPPTPSPGKPTPGPPPAGLRLTCLLAAPGDLKVLQIAL